MSLARPFDRQKRILNQNDYLIKTYARPPASVKANEVSFKAIVSLCLELPSYRSSTNL
jgi:hypothetical protein